MKSKPLLLTIGTALTVALFATITIFAQQTYQATAVRPANLSGDLLDILNANDEKLDTRAYSGKTNCAGMNVTLDIGSEQNVIGVAMDQGRWPTHFPGAYKVE